MKLMSDAIAEVVDYRERFVNFLKSFQDRLGEFKYRNAIATMATRGESRWSSTSTTSYHTTRTSRMT